MPCRLSLPGVYSLDTSNVDLPTSYRGILMLQKALFSLITLAFPLLGASVKVLFDPAKPETGPFPTDFLTAPSTTTKTTRRVRMPAPPDCAATPNACQDAWLASDFDGFNVQSRVRVRFSARINPDTIQSGIYLV